MTGTAFAALCLDIWVALLGADDWGTRRLAEAALRRHGWEARAALTRGEGSPDAEVRRSSALLRAEADERWIAALGQPLPEIDSAWFGGNAYQPDEWPERYYRMRPYLDLVGRDGSPWENYRTATRVWLRAELKAGTDPDQLRELVCEMRVRDTVWLRWPAPMPPAEDGP